MSIRLMSSRQLLLVVLAAVPACGDGPMIATERGRSVITPAVDSVVVQSDGGGYGRLPPVGASCDPGRWAYTLSLGGPRALIWSRCQVSGDGSTVADYASETGSRTLTADEWNAARDAARAVLVSSRTTCGADKDARSIEVRVGSDSYLYGDDFYACHRDYERFVESEGLDQVAATLAALAHD